MTLSTVNRNRAEEYTPLELGSERVRVESACR